MVRDAGTALAQGDITQQDVDAIVNAANESLLGGGGVDGAIHRAAGARLLEECRTLGGCETGNANITRGYNLKAKHVIHAVGPVYRDGKHNEPVLLASAYRTSLELASQNKCASIAFPAISTGIYGYPLEDAARIALRVIVDYLGEHPEITLARFVLYDARAFEVHARVLEQVLAE
ncbi:MAG: O-acetyl-ADP-ribose deacetylase [Chloroflexi bacterium]|nr:O-acetyl-ADP-ribose deacetylase [Chloroflexota bacterium]